MFTPLGKPRNLPFPLYNQASNGNITDDAGLTLNEFVWPEDPEERAILPLFVSQREFTAILSAMDVGADIAYPEQYVEVMWLMVRNLRYGVDICAMIADCITNNPETRQAIKDLVMSDPDIANYFTTIVEGLTTEQIVSPVLSKGCDNGLVAGAVIQIVDKLDEYNVDALQIIEVGTNDEERMASLIAGIPVFGALPVDEVFDVLQDFLEDFSENYVAAITPEWKDEVAEELYCLAKQSPDCKLTFEDLFNYFQQRALSGLTLLSTVFDLVNFIKTGDFDNDELVASGMYAVLLASLRTGREYFGMNLPKIGAITRDAGSSSAWEYWDECAPPGEPILNMTQFVGWETSCSWVFIEFSGTDEVWEVAMPEGGPQYSFTGVSGAEIDFYIMNEDVTEGVFSDVREYNTGAVQTDAPFRDNILITNYCAAFADVKPARMRLTLRPVL